MTHTQTTCHIEQYTVVYTIFIILIFFFLHLITSHYSFGFSGEKRQNSISFSFLWNFKLLPASSGGYAFTVEHRESRQKYYFSTATDFQKSVKDMTDEHSPCILIENLNKNWLFTNNKKRKPLWRHSNWSENFFYLFLFPIF